MRPALSRLKESKFDLLIVGGGITGACAAHDAALRGLSVGLIERADFGGGTSAASSRVLHGGIRYLQQLRPAKVRESARERKAFERMAPHLTRRIPMIIPTYPGTARGRAALAAAIRTYGLLVRGIERAVPEYLTAAECLARVPPLAGARITGAYVISECQMTNSERITLAVVRSAATRGAAIANYASARALTMDQRSVTGVIAQDETTGETFEIRARTVLQARGPWGADPLSDGFAPPVHWNSKGVHAITRSLSQVDGLAVPTRRPSMRVVGRRGRHLFIQPWRDASLIGTTNSPFAGGPEPRVCAADLEELLQDVNGALPGAGLTHQDVLHAYVGLFPNTRDPSRPEVYQATGDWLVIDHGRTGTCAGLFSAVGVKFTTARALAERAVDAAVHHLKLAAPACRTAETPLLGGDIQDVAGAREALQRKWPTLTREVVGHLIEQYGSEAAHFVASAGIEAVRPLTAGHAVSEADVKHAISAEYAVHLEDIVHRRTSMAATGMPSETLLQRCADVAAASLGWSAETRRLELERAMRRFPVVHLNGWGRSAHHLAQL